VNVIHIYYNNVASLTHRVTVT